MRDRRYTAAEVAAACQEAYAESYRLGELAFRERARSIIEPAAEAGRYDLDLALDLAEGGLPVPECLRILAVAGAGGRA